MNYNDSVNSELIESLDFLRPPVKRNLKNKNIAGTRGNFNTQSHNVQLRDICPNNNKSTVQSSTSLILTRTSERGVLERYSIVNYTNNLNPNRDIILNNKSEQNLNTDKPLIKVTIIPESEKLASAKSHRKHKKCSKRIHSTASNQETSIQTKNVYFIVTGRKKEKVYEIKTTGSAKLFKEQVTNNSKHEDVPIKELHTFKQLIKSLNMEKKKKQNKKRAKPLPQEVEEVAHICTCSDAVREETGKNIKSHRSRIRISGRIGVTEDDKYFLNYDATVDDKLCGTNSPKNYNEIHQSLSPTYLPVNTENIFHRKLNTAGCMRECSKNKALRYQRDSIIQANFQTHEECNQLPNLIRMPSKGSQSTQVNFNTDLTNDNKTNDKKQDQIVQCNRRNIVNNGMAVSDNESESYSPLVIISVYPKPYTTEVIKTVNCCNVENSRLTSPQRVYTGVQTSKQLTYDKKGIFNSNKLATETLRTSRSPSPTPRNPRKQKSQENNINKTRTDRANTRKESPGCQTAKTTNKRKPQKDKLQQDSKSKNKECFDATKISKNKLLKKDISPSHETKGTNTEHLLAKKVLVDNYTKKVTEHLNRKRLKPKNDASRVTINIDSENEFYDVLFDPGQLSTELTVRKTVKKKESQKCSKGDNSASMQNLLLISDQRDTRTRCCTQAQCNKQTVNDTEASCMPRLNVRDSMEINHRREDKVCHSTKNIETNCSSKLKDLCSEDMEFLAPIKHFTGDNCTISDPVERDKEIRGLLGIKSNRESALQMKKSKERSFENSKQVSVHCFFHEKCDPNLTGFNQNILWSDISSRQNKCKKSKDDKRNKDREIIEKLQSSNEKRSKTIAIKSSDDQFDQEKYLTKPRRTLESQWYESERKQDKLILNRNVQVFLQVEQFSKKKPIILSRKQYKKVKKTIQSTLSNKQERRKSNSICRCSQVYVGEVRMKAKRNKNSDTEVQTNKIRKKHSKDSSQNKATIKEEKVVQLCSTVFALPVDVSVVLKDDKHEVTPRQAVSSVEIRYANVAYAKRVTFSTTNIGVMSTSAFAKKNSHSIQTLFRGHKKSATPNLGTSVFSLMSESGLYQDTKSVKCLMTTEDTKPRKPFLKRLMSCLVLRSTKDFVPKIPYRAPQEPSADSSIDSYHISTSLGAIEMTSSLYDTSASFYSNHTIQPVNSKTKRSFFSSVRGFLTNRKS